MNKEQQDVLSHLWALETERQAAMVSKDLTTLDRLLDDELIYVHGTGRLMTKAEYLDHVGSDDFAYLSIAAPTEQRSCVSDHMVMLVQQVSAAMFLGGKRVETRLSVAATWRISATGWRLVGSSAARITA